jgi:hypothetical protein
VYGMSVAGGGDEAGGPDPPEPAADVLLKLEEDRRSLRAGIAVDVSTELIIGDGEDIVQLVA